MRYRVAVAAPLDHFLVYSHPHELVAGVRVRVPLGKRRVTGVVLGPEEEKDTSYEIKPIVTVYDAIPWYSPTLMKLAEFVSNYYHAPLGRVLALMSPAYFSTKPLQDEAGVSPGASAPDLVLTTAQHEALIEIESAKKPVLLRGVTDSGKTEIYIHLIRNILTKYENRLPPQFLLMVPEISLTAQMTQIFSHRFPQQVVVTHSGLSAKQRWQSFQQVRTNSRSILIGPRSSVFAPFANLKLIIVDEEHDSSYKQDSHLAYHGRDIAVYRGKLEKAKVVLGSATPALESWQNSLQGKYKWVELQKRIHDNKHQAIRLIKKNLQVTRTDVKKIDPERDTELFSAETATKIAHTLAASKQVIVIINRRGFSHYLLIKGTDKVVTCPNCSVSLTLHDNFKLLKCHYCDYRTTLAQIIASHAKENFQICGHGSERIEKILQTMFPDACIARLDSDTATKKDNLNQVLTRFRKKDIDILVGTQMLAKGHDFPDVSLLVVLHADQMLSMPDFRAAERTFQLLVQAMGRAGRSEDPSEVLIEVARTDLPIIKAALEQDYHAFTEQELLFRQKFRYPPFIRLACLELHCCNAKKLHQKAIEIAQLFAETRDLNIRGPSDPPITKINNRHRKVIFFSAPDATKLHILLSFWLQRLRPMLAKDIKLKIDIDPVTTL